MARVDNRRYSPDELDEVRRLNPVEEVAPEYGVALRREGKTFKGFCPFHADRKTPNFTVFPHTQSWRCFACPDQPHGDVIEFLRRKEHLSFPEAVERLKARRGIQPGGALASGPQAGSRKVLEPVRRQWDRLSLEEQLVMNTAHAVYKDALWHSQPALDYLRERGIPNWAVRECGLGYADGHSLELELRRHGGLGVAERLGLLRSSSNGERGASHYRELLAGRIVVPELRGGQPMWFIGRVLQTATSRTASPADGESGATAANGEGRRPPPKYLALPGERPVLGFERAAGRREAFLCEGVFDYLTAASWRLAACSFCGTYLPPDKLGFLASARAIYGLFDPDQAGQAASARVAEQLGPRFQPVPLPDGCDLNDLGTRGDGRPIFSSLLATARDRRGDLPEPANAGSHLAELEVANAYRH